MVPSSWERLYSHNSTQPSRRRRRVWQLGDAGSRTCWTKPDAVDRSLPMPWRRCYAQNSGQDSDQNSNPVQGTSSTPSSSSTPYGWNSGPLSTNRRYTKGKVKKSALQRTQASTNPRSRQPSLQPLQLRIQRCRNSRGWYSASRSSY